MASFYLVDIIGRDPGDEDDSVDEEGYREAEYEPDPYTDGFVGCEDV
jgi:hypothetical protein